MIVIRDYQEADAQSVGKLIAGTYSEFNLAHLPPDERGPFLGPFQYARSPESAHQDAIAQVIRAAMVFVADDDGEILGVLRGRRDKLQSLFVSGDHHRQGIGRELVKRFEEECAREGSREIWVRATLFAVPFYLSMGYKRTTGVRSMRSFEGRGLPYQPMKKVLGDDRGEL